MPEKAFRRPCRTSMQAGMSEEAALQVTYHLMQCIFQHAFHTKGSVAAKSEVSHVGTLSLLELVHACCESCHARLTEACRASQPS